MRFSRRTARYEPPPKHRWLGYRAAGVTRGLDKTRIVELLRAQGPMAQEAIRAALREEKNPVKVALGVMKKSGILAHSPVTGKWRLK